MRFGRIIRPNRDKLFADSDTPCGISSGAVLLPRQSIDDYVRFRVPDTYCPPLPEPGTPLDDGAADNAEPARWSWSGRPGYYGSGWQFGPNWDDNLNFVRPSYACYDGNFLTFVECTWGGGSYGVYVADWFGLVLPDYGCGIGIGGAIIPDPLFELPAAYFAFQQGGTWYVWGGSASYTVSEGTTFFLFLRRAGSTIYGGFSRIGSGGPEIERELATGVTGPVLLAVGKDYSIAGGGGQQRRLGVVMSRWGTVYGAPNDITVTTPLIDLGQPLESDVRVVPTGVTLEWRADNSPFDPNGSDPAWSNPTGEFQYWQARASTASLTTLIERIEVVPVGARMSLWRRFRAYWQLFETGMGRLTKGPFRTVFGSGGQARTDTGWIQLSDEERNVGDW